MSLSRFVTLMITVLFAVSILIDLARGAVGAALADAALAIVLGWMYYQDLP